MMTDYDYDNGIYEYPRDGIRDSDEDTEDASETEESMKPFNDEYDYMEREYRPRDYEIKEQIYRDQLAALRDQLDQLESECHPEFAKGLEKVKQTFDERRFFIQACFEWQQQRIMTDYANEEKAAMKEFNEQRDELKSTLISDLEEKKKLFEADTLELSFDTTEPKPTTTRKLRRRPNDPIPMPDRRRRASPAHINYLLDDHEIADDIKQLNKILNAVKSMAREERKNRDRENNSSNSKNNNFDCDGSLTEARLEDGKLFYDKKWFHRGQNILIESLTEGWKCTGLIHQIGSNEVRIQKNNDSLKIKVTLADLHSRKYIFQRRS